MKQSIFLALILAGAVFASSAQTTAKPATTTTTATKSTATKSAAATTAKSSAPSAAKLPPGIPPVKALTKTLYAVALRYQDALIGKGPLAESGKLYTIHYTGYLAADGAKFDSSHDHPEQPVIGKDGKPELDADGQPKRAAGQPIQFVQGQGRTIPGFDLGFEGMHIGGKRRLFIPWQLGYGLRGMPSPDPKRVSIPSKADLIFDIELLDVTDPPVRQQMPQRPMGARPGGIPPRPAQPNGQPAQPGQPNPSAQPATPGQPVAPQSSAPTPANPSATPSTPATTPAPQQSPNQASQPDQPKQ